MSRLIDRPGAQVPNRVVVDTNVLVELLRLAAANDKLTWKGESEELYRLARKVVTGELVSLTSAEWPAALSIDQRASAFMSLAWFVTEERGGE